MHELLVAITGATVLVAVSVLVFYEVLRLAWVYKERFVEKPRMLAFHLIIAIFVAHTLCVWIYGVAYWVMIDWMGLDGLHSSMGGVVIPEEPRSLARLLMYIYFSVTCYSSLGFGDLAPNGPLRMIAGVEAVNGLLLIGWSVTYSYFAMERYLSFTKPHKRPREK